MSRRPTERELERAAAEFQAFHWGSEPSGLVHARAPAIEPGTVLVKLGSLVEVHYRTHKGATRATWWHAFRSPLPVLASTLDGQLVVVGGGYRVRPEGIVG